jgi:lipoate-protein ligase A
MMLDELQIYDDLEPHPAALNMAVDEALLETATQPVLRFYRWRKPSISFGYFGRFADVASERRDREIVRRWTGGGIVPHGDDLTYSIIIPAAAPFFARSSLEMYAAIHDAIRRALQANGIGAVLANAPAPKVSENCFANAVRADVMRDGHKIAGAAHRRSRAGLLHQGSIQHRNLPDRFRTDFARLLCDRPERRTLSARVLERSPQIVATKYGTDEWLRRR